MMVEILTLVGSFMNYCERRKSLFFQDMFRAAIFALFTSLSAVEVQTLDKAASSSLHN